MGEEEGEGENREVGERERARARERVRARDLKLDAAHVLGVTVPLFKALLQLRYLCLSSTNMSNYAGGK